MKSKIDFVNGNTKKSLLMMVIPLLAAMILTMAYNLVDSLWVGNLLGESGYAALTNSTAIVLILSAIAMGCSSGVSILVSQKVGEKNKKATECIIATLLIMSIAFGLIVTVGIELSLNSILVWMNTPTELLASAYDYLSVYMIGYIAIYVYMQFTALFRSFGDPIFQMKGMLISTIFNAVLDPIMINFFGLKGAAWATVFSEILCVVFAVIYHKKKKMFSIDFKKASFAYVKPILADVVPSAIQNCMPAISSAVMLYLVTDFGVTTIAAYGVTNKLEILLFYPAMAMNMALTTISGQCFGAKRPDRAKDYLKTAIVFGAVFIAIITAIVMVFSKQLCGLFINSVEASSIVATFFCIVSIGYVMYMITCCFLGNLSGLGKPSMSMLMFFLYYIVIRIPLAIVLVNTQLQLNGIWTAILISHIVSPFLAGGLLYFEQHRKKKKL